MEKVYGFSCLFFPYTSHVIIFNVREWLTWGRKDILEFFGYSRFLEYYYLPSSYVQSKFWFHWKTWLLGAILLSHRHTSLWICSKSCWTHMARPPDSCTCRALPIPYANGMTRNGNSHIACISFAQTHAPLFLWI
jgi:hypothetical protein